VRVEVVVEVVVVGVVAVAEQNADTLDALAAAAAVDACSRRALELRMADIAAGDGTAAVAGSTAVADNSGAADACFRVGMGMSPMPGRHTPTAWLGGENTAWEAETWKR
jgi:hypothetical protein